MNRLAGRFRCAEHGVDLVYDFPQCGWVCPEDDSGTLVLPDRIVERMRLEER